MMLSSATKCILPFGSIYGAGTLKIECGRHLFGFPRQYDQLGDNVLMLWELDVACCFDYAGWCVFMFMFLVVK